MIIKQIRHADILIFGGTSSAIDFAVREQQKGRRVLLVTGFTYFGEEQCAYLNCGDRTPLQIKQQLDRKVLDNHLPFYFRSWPLKITPEAFFFGNSQGIFAVQAGLAVDFSLHHSLARLADGILPAFVPGEKSYRRTILSRSREYEILEGTIPVSEDSISAWESAEARIRQQTWSNRHLHTADLCQIEDRREMPAVLTGQRILLPEQLQNAPEPQSYIPRAELELKLEELPVLKQVQVLVAGAGTAGAPAGIASGRAGASTLVLEEMPHAGGTGTEGRIASYWFGLKRGFTAEADREVALLQGDQYPELCPGTWSIECKQHYWERELLRAKTEIWYLYSCCGCIRKDSRLTAAIVAGPYGGGLVTAEQFIDATGNADLAAFCGEPTTFSDEDEPAVQGAAMSPVRLDKDYVNTDYMFTLDSSNRDITRALITGRDRFRNSGFYDMAQLHGTRERRRIRGELTFQPTDFYANKTYPDTITLAQSNFDTHGFTVHPFLLFCPTDEEPKTVQIPLRVLLSPGLQNLLTTGLGISAHRDAMPLVRMQPDVQNQGYAAGLAAAAAAQEQKNLRELDMPRLQQKLMELDILPRDFRTNSGHLPENALAEARIFQQPDFPELERQFREHPDFEQALRLALLGNSTGCAFLQHALAKAAWDQGWNYRGMGQFGMSSSRLDCAIIALAGISRDFGPMEGLLRQITPDTELSHFRACCFFLMKHSDPAQAAVLEALLRQFSCHAVQDLNGLLDSPITDDTDVTERNFQLKELYLAAALRACQPDNATAESFLQQYASGVHRFYALFAEKYLRQFQP